MYGAKGTQNVVDELFLIIPASFHLLSNSGRMLIRNQTSCFIIKEVVVVAMSLTLRYVLHSTVHYCDQVNNACQFRASAVPTNLQAKFMLLSYFANYMDKHLLKVRFPIMIK